MKILVFEIHAIVFIPLHCQRFRALDFQHNLSDGRAFDLRQMNAPPTVEMQPTQPTQPMQTTFTRSKPAVVYSQSTIVGIIDDTTGKYVKTVIAGIMDAFASYLKSAGSVGANSWEYMFECDYGYMTALNTEIQKYFDTSVFVRVYGGGAGSSSNKLICKVNWGAD